MRAFKIFQSLLTAFLIGHLATLTVFASEEGALQNSSPDSQRTSAVLVLPHGVLVGEFDSRAWNYPYNGLFISKDLGNSWVRLGLQGRGVTDTAFDEYGLFVSTYYKVDGKLGLFRSTDGGRTFHHSGLNFSGSAVDADNTAVYLGGYSHGLWVSYDHGSTWEQKLGDGSGWTGPSITTIKTGDELVFAATPTKVYRSLDHGVTWTEVPPLEGKQTHTFHISNNIIMAGSLNNEGMYRSIDSGVSWNKVSNWGDHGVGEITSFKKTVIAQKFDQQNLTYKLFKSYDHGDTWQDTGIDAGQRINNADALFSYPSYIFISTQTAGIYKYEVPQPEPNRDEFLQIPWSYSSENELIDKITAYFDHQYPLLGYSHFDEPQTYKDTTVNYLGFREDIHANFYNSHNGTDFALPFGEEILAPAPGYARYYFCHWCGRSIKIDHLNGYQTVYMHLQKDGLVAGGTEPIWVNSGDVIGKVGMSGRTSGPHLHFGVTRDKNGNSLFDDYPDGLVDPFSWMDPYNIDPWEAFSWHDDQGHHSGTSSEYLWEYSFPLHRLYISEENNTAVLENVTVTIDLDDFESNVFTASIANFIKPNLPISQLDLEYIENTSLSITGSDHYEERVVSIDGAVTITIDLTNLNLSNIVKDSLKICVWNPLVQKLEPLPTIIDYINNKLSAQTDHLSHFVVLGEKIYPNPPVSSITLIEDQPGSWFTELPQVNLSAQDNSGLGIKAIYYSDDNGIDWEVYSSPFYLDSSGVTTILYRAEDLAGNLEITNSYVAKVDIGNSRKDQARIINNTFETVF